ncbi:MAG: hypothetical protein JXB04_00340 [Kiritimatiellae bacterium]|nr:hypothetical protein [Kiritimatiellia bacterium]
MILSLRHFVRRLGLLLAAACLVLAAGCATTGDDYESEIPWNEPQPWEGSPMIPGMERM